ncbi:MAG: calcium-binding protein [Solirubrobacteraceae bacterium]
MRSARAAGAVAAVLLLVLAGARPARAESVPVVTSGGAGEISPTSVTLSGTVASSSALQGCWFEWGVPPRFETSAPCRLGPPEGSLVHATVEASGLVLGTAYGWRLAARNAAGVAHGSTESFTTLGYPVGERPLEAAEAIGVPGPEPPAEPAVHGRVEDGLYVAYCPLSGELGAQFASSPRASSAMANHSGWPPLQCLKMDKGTYGFAHTLIGLPHIHNWLLGGYGNDTIWAGEDGDVIWADYHPSGQSTSEHDVIHGGAGADWIYSSHGHNEIWTGAGDDHLALVYGRGIIRCNGPGLKTLVMRYLPRNRHWRLVDCKHIRIEPYRA